MATSNHVAAIRGLAAEHRLGAVYAVDPWAARAAQAAAGGGGSATSAGTASGYWPLKLDGYPFEDFHPHGLSLWNAGRTRDVDGEEVVFVVNHRREGDFVERFTLARDAATGRPAALVYRESVGGWQLNDVAAVGPRAFFVSNWLWFPKGSLLNKFETYLQLKMTRVSRCDPQQGGDTAITCVQATPDEFAMSNGVAVSPDGTLLYIAETIKRDVHVYRIGGGGGGGGDRNDKGDKSAAAAADPRAALELVETIHVGMGVDNLDVDPATGDLYVAGHPQLILFPPHEKDPEAVPAPSEVQRISRVDGTVRRRRRGFRFKNRVSGSYRVETLLMLDGRDPPLAASSVAAFGTSADGSTSDLVIGPVFVNGVLHCNMTAAPSKSVAAAEAAEASCPWWKRLMQ
jgi:hypothetical protein